MKSRLLGALLAAFAVSLLGGCIVVPGDYHDGGGYHHHYHDRD